MFLTLGKSIKLFSKLNRNLTKRFASPLASKRPVKAYARIYGGIAKGSIKAHSKNLFP